jgi:hypothetical protein
MLRSSFWKNSEDFVAKMRKYVALWPLAARERDRSQREMREKGAERAHSDWANFSYMSHSGTEASFDFYHLSTSARARFGSLRDLQHMRMRAVARVQTSVFTMAHLIDDVEEVVKAIGAYLPSRADQDDADAEIPPAEVRRG